MVVVGFGPRYERALFLTEGQAAPAKAFAAVVPPLDRARAFTEKSLLNAPRPRRHGGTGSLNDAPRAVAALLAGAVPGVATGPEVESALLIPEGPVTPGTGSGIPGTPDGVGTPPRGTPFTPTGPTSNPPTPTAGAPGSPGPVPTPSPTPTDPVGAVPEPATWLMMILGFFAIGVTTRRRPARRTDIAKLA